VLPPSFEPSRLRVAGRWSSPRPPRPCPSPDLPSRISPPVASRLTSMHPTSGPWRRSRLFTSRIRPQSSPLSRKELTDRLSWVSPCRGIGRCATGRSPFTSAPLASTPGDSVESPSELTHRCASFLFHPRGFSPPRWFSLRGSCRFVAPCSQSWGSPAFPESRSGVRFHAPVSTTRSPQVGSPLEVFPLEQPCRRRRGRSLLAVRTPSRCAPDVHRCQCTPKAPVFRTTSTSRSSSALECVAPATVSSGPDALSFRGLDSPSRYFMSTRRSIESSRRRSLARAAAVTAPPEVQARNGEPHVPSCGAEGTRPSTPPSRVSASDHFRSLLARSLVCSLRHRSVCPLASSWETLRETGDGRRDLVPLEAANRSAFDSARSSIRRKSLLR
jgi:hypothetical protein